MTQYTDGPADQPWEVEKHQEGAYLQRRGYNERAKSAYAAREACIWIDAAEDEVLTELAARLNDLDTARARIALLEARLEALCGAVGAETVARNWWAANDKADALLDPYLDAVAETYRCAKAAREALNG